MKVLETERLILRPWTIDDLEDFYEYAKNPNIGPNAGWEPHSNKEDSKKILELFIEKDETWAIVYKENDKVIGSIGLHTDEKRNGINSNMLGYVLSEEYWGKGIMTEAVKCVIKYAFEEIKLDILSVCHYTFNNRSKRVIEKCGFKYEGTIRCAKKLYDTRIVDEVCYSILKEEYFN
ncbi:GNAT family N-acetyltransferase [Clostridium uliginosum]|uniref:Putative acetyltransferase n=1 Tax=Clostridium uliginosum TaxID=119641 RepID=A0A1I1J0W2_9CLOT|nr:GNAT family protein [Clostridium uliginosum]SFC42197.1 putative acetyltransferase [Clostridium uliginosum]